MEHGLSQNVSSSSSRLFKNMPTSISAYRFKNGNMWKLELVLQLLCFIVVRKWEYLINTKLKKKINWYEIQCVKIIEYYAKVCLNTKQSRQDDYKQRRGQKNGAICRMSQNPFKSATRWHRQLVSVKTCIPVS